MSETETISIPKSINYLDPEGNYVIIYTQDNQQIEMKFSAAGAIDLFKKYVQHGYLQELDPDDPYGSLNRFLPYAGDIARSTWQSSDISLGDHSIDGYLGELAEELDQKIKIEPDKTLCHQRMAVQIALENLFVIATVSPGILDKYGKIRKAGMFSYRILEILGSRFENYVPVPQST